jgi:ATP-dependent Clp protease ATP-binding subunit ClpA
MQALDTHKRSKEAQQVFDTLKKKVVGQEEAVRILVDMVESYQAGFTEKDRPAGNALFLGPTGSGKTHTVEMLCKGLFGDERACIKIDCGEFQHSHEISRLIGSPPGYLGHRETHPVLTQEALSQFHTENMKLSVVLFDEIEKASDALWTLMLGILDKATLTLGDNRRVDFSSVILLMTSNLGSRQMEDVTDGGIGYNCPEVAISTIDEKIETVVKEAAKRHFSPEFYNRINHTAVFRTLTQEQIKEVLEIELGQLQTRLLFNSKVKFFFHVLPLAKAVLIKEGFSKRYGARHLKRAVDQRIVTPLARLVASGQVLERDVLLIEYVGKEEFEFSIAKEKL